MTSLDGCIDAAEKMSAYTQWPSESVEFLDHPQYAAGCMTVMTLDRIYGHGVYFFPDGYKWANKTGTQGRPRGNPG